jgi:hypothetical protein
MSNEQYIKKHLEEIVSSKIFSRSSINISLLKLIVESTLKKEELREINIGYEIFGDSYDPIKNDAKVRVYVYNLRKKLKQYYETENKNAPYKFVLAKGEYKVNFIKQKKSRKQTYLFASVLLAFLLSIGYYLITKKEVSFWGEFFNNGKQNMLLVGDHFTILGELPTGGEGVFRDYNINSQIDYNNYLKKHGKENLNLIPNDFTYITQMGVYSTFNLSKWFTLNNEPLSVRLLTEWSIKDFTDVNIIYVGQVKTMGFLEAIFLKYNPHFIYIKKHFEKITKNGSKKNIYRSSLNVDYTIFSKIKTDEGTNILFVLSRNDVGVTKFVDEITNSYFIEKFEEEYNIGDKNFSAIYSVTGKNRTGYNVKLEEMEVY